MINVGDILSTMEGVQYCGDIMSTVEAYLEYHGGYHDARGGYHEYRGVFTTVGVFSTVGYLNNKRFPPRYS